MSKPITATMVIACADVAGFAAACQARTDAEAFEMLNRFYLHAAATIAPAQGRLIKTMGDAVLVVFPESHAVQAVAAMRDLKATVQDLWSEFGTTCRVRIHAHVGPVACGPLGPGQHFDVIGRTVNDLFRMPWDGPELSAALSRKLASRP